MDIFELAKAKKMFGGGGGKREGTAIPVGEVVDRIYFNTELPVEEMRNYLSQLTYVQTPLLESPLCAIYAKPTGDNTGIFIFATIARDNEYSIECVTNIVTQEFATLYFTVSADDSGKNSPSYNGWQKAYRFKQSNAEEQFDIGVDSLGVFGASITDFNGIPVGAENEKIKNVLSITPF